MYAMDQKVFLERILGRRIRIGHEKETRIWTFNYYGDYLWRFLLRRSMGTKSSNGMEPNLGWALFVCSSCPALWLTFPRPERRGFPSQTG